MDESGLSLTTQQKQIAIAFEEGWPWYVTGILLSDDSIYSDSEYLETHGKKGLKSHYYKDIAEAIGRSTPHLFNMNGAFGFMGQIVQAVTDPKSAASSELKQFLADMDANFWFGEKHDASAVFEQWSEGVLRKRLHPSQKITVAVLKNVKRLCENADRQYNCILALKVLKMVSDGDLKAQDLNNAPSLEFDNERFVGVLGKKTARILTVSAIEAQTKLAIESGCWLKSFYPNYQLNRAKFKVFPNIPLTINHRSQASCADFLFFENVDPARLSAHAFFARNCSHLTNCEISYALKRLIKDTKGFDFLWIATNVNGTQDFRIIEVAAELGLGVISCNNGICKIELFPERKKPSAADRAALLEEALCMSMSSRNIRRSNSIPRVEFAVLDFSSEEEPTFQSEQ